MVVTLVMLLVVLALDIVTWSGGPEGYHVTAQWLGSLYVIGIIVYTTIDMIRDMMRGHFGLDILAVVAMAAAVATGEYLAALIVVLMLTGGEALEDYAAMRAQSDLNALLKRAPQTAHRLDPDNPDAPPVDVPASEVRPGDLLLLRPAEIVPVDGTLESGEAEFDESTMTGESLPVLRETGDEIYSGTVNATRAVRMRATASAANSQYQQIMALVSDAQEQKAPTVRLADRYAVPFTIVSLIIAGLAWWFSGDPVRFAAVLVLATPCPLLIAAPVAFIGGMSAAARDGIIVKGGATLEALAKTRSVTFDKTGTLSHGHPELVAIRSTVTAGQREGSALDSAESRQLLQYAASAENYSSHVLAEGVITAAREQGLEQLPTTDASEYATQGVEATVDGHVVRVGKLAFIQEIDPSVQPVDLEAGQTSVAVSIDGRGAGMLILADALRENARPTVDRLRELGVEDVLMLTGDNEQTAHALAEQANITEVHANLRPQDKVDIVRELEKRPVTMVGDGVNDAPVLAIAEVGIAMGAKGATAASESADAVIRRDDIGLVARAVEIGGHTYRVALSAIWLGMILSVGLMLVAAFGYIIPVIGALLQELVDLAAILYALRARTGGKSKVVLEKG
ncbi:heavy metal translocating P-type ATPase [Gulosibacter molinativorax]|uniref:heavy metal translocating P-type ATPase n=1 Tax=Gulosibacter molinativorax TaxID=256821 RepID=UPI001FDEDFDC|nr:heavy metal translocating P-type ATPase [Gulosibacter molinativorax]